MKRLRWIWQGDRYLRLTILMAVVASLSSFAYFFYNNLTLLNIDASSHLMIAKRVVHGLTPGFAHLGGYWLPLPHILILPFIWNDFMYWSGLAGSIVSISSFVLTTVFIYKIALLFTGDKKASLIATFIFAINPNVLYMQSTPMTESLLILFMVASVYYLSKWSQNVDNLQYLFGTALAVFLATLTRYEGWALLLVVMAVLLYICTKNRFGYQKIEAHLIYFGSLAGFGILFWLIWEQVILGDFLFFHRGEYSNLSFAVGSETTGNLYMSTLSYSISTLMNVGVVGLLLGIAGLVYFLVSNQPKADKISMLVLVSPIPFFIYSLYGGQVEQKVPGIGSGGMYCIRYGLLMVPAFAVFAGYLAKRPWIKVLVVIAVSAGIVTMVLTNNIAALNDSAATRLSARSIQTSIAAKWLSSNYDEGLVLMENKNHEILTFESRIPMKNFIYEGSLGYWETSLEDPTKHAHWILMTQMNGRQDKVWKALHNTPQLLNYDLVYQNGGTEIYKRKNK